jgi:amino acid adenylation domain-containing protein
VLIPDLFEAQVVRTPAAVAVTYQGQSLTYRQLNRRANQLANYLMQAGARPDVCVGLCLERSIDLLVGVLGVLKAGAAYVPLDPSDPQERLAFMLRDAGVSVMVTQQRHAHRLLATTVPTLRLDADREAIELQPGDDPARRITGENLSYIIYTSGSTGAPKGVMITHRGFANLMAWTQAAFPLSAADVVLQKTPFTFSVWELYAPLLVGARLVIANPGGHRDPRYLIDLIRTQKISHLKLVPSLLQAMAEESGLDQCTSLRWVSSGGEALSWGALERFLARLDVVLVNLYGPTETTHNAAFWVARQRVSTDVVPIGHPIANTQLHILDAHMQPVPYGVPGELYVGGVCVARGYLRQPELTAERFVPNPFGDEAGARLYRTGDRARYLPDGSIEFLGRMDRQVKIRGHRVEPGEIETVLVRHPAVRDVAVLPREDRSGGKRLVAYVVPAQSSALTAASLRGFLDERLPGYMIPARFMMLDTMPLTPNGKVDRQRLSAVGDAGPGRGTAYVGPTDALEQQLVEIWEELLDVCPIGIHDEFFEAGGNSLLAIQMMQAIERSLGRRFPVPVLFSGVTIDHLARALRQRETATYWSIVTPVQPESSRLPFFFLHGHTNLAAGGYCRAVAQTLGPEQPVFAIHPHGMSGERIPVSIEAMAIDHLSTIRAIQPTGPYFLGGASGPGGLVAFEIARRLRSQGETVGLLALLDTANENAWAGAGALRWFVDCYGALRGLTPTERLRRFVRVRRPIVHLRGRAGHYRRRLRELAGLTIGEEVAAFSLGAKRVREKIADAFRPRRQGPAAPVSADDGGPRWGRKLSPADRELWDSVMAGYVPRRYPGKITLFRSPEWRPEDGWRAVACEIEVHVTPSADLNPGTPSFRVLDEHLGASLRNTQAERGAAGIRWNGALAWTQGREEHATLSLLPAKSAEPVMHTTPHGETLPD